MGSPYCCLPYLPPTSTISSSVPSLTPTFIPPPPSSLPPPPPSSSSSSQISISLTFPPQSSLTSLQPPQSSSTAPEPTLTPTVPPSDESTSSNNTNNETDDDSDDDSDDSNESGPSGGSKDRSEDEDQGPNVNLLTAILAAIGAGSFLIIAIIGIIAWTQRDRKRRRRGSLSTAASIWGKDRRDAAMALEAGLGVPSRGDSVDSDASSNGRTDGLSHGYSSYVYSPSNVPQLPAFASQVSATTSPRSISTIFLPRPSLSVIESLSGTGSPTLVPPLPSNATGSQRPAITFARGNSSRGAPEKSMKDDTRRKKVPGLPATPRVTGPREQDEYLFPQHPYRRALPVPSSPSRLQVPGMTKRQASGLSHLFAAPLHSPSPSPVQGPEDSYPDLVPFRRPAQTAFASSAPTLARPETSAIPVPRAASASPSHKGKSPSSTDPPRNAGLAPISTAVGVTEPTARRPRPLGPFLLPFPVAPSSAPPSPMRPPRPRTLSPIEDNSDLIDSFPLQLPTTPLRAPSTNPNPGPLPTTPRAPGPPPTNPNPDSYPSPISHHEYPSPISHPYRQESSEGDSVASLRRPRGRSDAAGDGTSSWWSDDSSPGEDSSRRRSSGRRSGERSGEDGRRRSGREILVRLSQMGMVSLTRRPWSGLGPGPVGRAS